MEESQSENILRDQELGTWLPMNANYWNFFIQFSNDVCAPYSISTSESTDAEKPNINVVPYVSAVLVSALLSIFHVRIQSNARSCTFELIAAILLQSNSQSRFNVILFEPVDDG
jgi:hypothetical protein